MRVDRRLRDLKPHRRSQRPALRLGQDRELIDHRPQEVVERGERPRRLALGRPRPQHSRSSRRRTRRLGHEQRGLAHTRVALDEHRERPVVRT